MMVSGWYAGWHFTIMENKSHGNKIFLKIKILLKLLRTTHEIMIDEVSERKQTKKRKKNWIEKLNYAK